MASPRTADTGWRHTLRTGRGGRVAEAERDRRREETRRLLARRDTLPSIAPDTTGQYLHELRAEADATHAGGPADATAR